ASFSLLGHARRADNWFQLRKNCFLARGSEDPDAHFAVAEIQYRRETSNAVPQPEVGTAIKFDTGDFQTIDKLNGNFVQTPAQHHRRKAPSGGKLDQHGLTGFQNFDLEVRFIDINCRFHTHCAFDVSGRLRGPRRVLVAPSPHSSAERGQVAPPSGTRRSRTWDTRHSVRPIPDAGRASRHGSGAEARCKNEFVQTW